MGGIEVTLKLSPEHALVLFEWLSKFNKREGNEFADQAEQRALWDLESILEKNLPQVFDPQYEQLLQNAWAVMRDAVD